MKITRKYARLERITYRFDALDVRLALVAYAKHKIELSEKYELDFDYDEQGQAYAEVIVLLPEQEAQHAD